ncbi:hypothetical protein FHT85_002845 [Rhizobium sp. BK312]|nr:hypothetical protein [Rhizobium sp. BK312]
MTNRPAFGFGERPSDQDPVAALTDRLEQIGRKAEFPTVPLVSISNAGSTALIGTTFFSTSTKPRRRVM